MNIECPKCEGNDIEYTGYDITEKQSTYSCNDCGFNGPIGDFQNTDEYTIGGDET